jgi:ferritin-like metal-binding protein YciE
MTEAIQNRINRYLEDTIAAERNFESALSSFGEAGVQPEVQQLLSSFSAKAKTQHERLTALLESRGGSPSAAKTVLAEMLAFTSLSAQIGQGAAEKNTQHLMVTFAAASAEMAMYESLIAAAIEAGDEEVISLGRKLQAEEHDDYEQTWTLLKNSAASAFRDEIAKNRHPDQIIVRYLEDAIAAEKSFETQLEGFSKEGDDAAVQNLFAQHARETKAQYEQLTRRLETLGGSTSTLKSFLAHIFNFAPKVAQLGHDASERLTQNLMMAYAVENAEVAMYESLATVARLIGDSQTEQLALEIQQQERETAEKIWAQVAPAARRSIQELRLPRAS